MHAKNTADGAHSLSGNDGNEYFRAEVEKRRRIAQARRLKSAALTLLMCAFVAFLVWMAISL